MRLPEDLTETEVEKTIVLNRLVRELCLHELRLADAIAAEDGRDHSTPDDYYAAVCSTTKLRETLHELYGEPS
jgi:hypothetical protein